MNSNNTQYWKMLEERYFDGTATDEEERLLLRFAATTTDPAFHELQAVLGFVCAERSQSKAERRQSKAERRKRRMAVFRYAAAAAVILAVGVAAILRSVSTEPLPAAAEEDIVAYVGGQRITDEAEILSLMNSTLEAMGTDTDIADQQLQDMLETLD